MSERTLTAFTPHSIKPSPFFTSYPVTITAKCLFELSRFVLPTAAPFFALRDVGSNSPPFTFRQNPVVVLALVHHEFLNFAWLPHSTKLTWVRIKLSSPVVASDRSAEVTCTAKMASVFTSTACSAL